MSENNPLIYSKIIEVMGKLNAITKDRKNQQQGFKFRGIDDVMNELHSKLAECGVFVVPCVEHEERSERTTSKGGVLFYTRLTVRFTFYASDGSSIQSVVIGEAMDSGDKASNKALSIAFKYACLQVFCIPTEDDKDPDAVCHEVAPKNEYKPQPTMYNAPKSAPAPKPAAPLAGGASTPKQQATIKNLLASTLETGEPIFTNDEKRDWLEKRKTMTADEVINALKNILGIKDFPEGLV